ncbi:uncharacterized protein LOC134436010 [Engraulis encrasicolus]|uniref:uncharacterized protein LOC134436010 n=1 Tax=Engraulis encrasicolus TaxID=184585 RepID=UPI002FCF423C
MSALNRGVIGEGEKLKKDNFPVPKQNLPAEQHEDPSKKLFYQGSHLEGRPTLYPPAIYQDSQFLHHGVIREGEKHKNNNISVPEQNISADGKVFYQWADLEGTSTSYSHAREGEKLKNKKKSVPEHNILAERTEDLSKNNVYQVSQTERIHASYPPALYQGTQTTEMSGSNRGVIAEGEKLTNNKEPVIELNIPEVRVEEPPKTAFWQGLQFEASQSVTRSLANEQAATQETLEMTRMGVSSQEELHPPDNSSSGQSLSDSNTAMIPHVGSDPTGVLPGAAFPLVPCHNEEKTLIPLKCLSQQRDGNIRASGGKEIESPNISFKSEPSPAKPNENIRNTVQNLSKDCGEENRLDVPGKECPSIDGSNTVAHPSLTELHSLKNKDYAHLSVDAIGQTELSELEPSPLQPNKTGQHLLKELGEEKGSDVPAKDYPSIVRLKDTEHLSMPDLNTPKDKNHSQLSVDAIEATELSESGASPSGSDRTDENLLKGCGEEKSSDVHSNNFSKPAEQPSLAEMDGPKEKECGEEKSPDVPGNDCPSIDCSKAAEYSPLAEMDNTKNEDLPQLSVDVIGETKLSESGRSPSRSDRIAHHLLKECGEEKSSDVHSNEGSKPAEHPSLAEMDSPKGKECGEEKSPDVPGNDCPSIDCSKAAEYSSLAEMDNTKNEDLPHLSVDVIGETKLSESGRSPSRSDRTAHNLLKECGEENNSDVHGNGGSKPAEHPSLAEMDSPKGKECGEEKSSDVPGKDCPRIVCLKDAKYSSLAEMDNAKNEDLSQIGGDVLGELRLCKGEPYLPKSDQLQDVPGKGFPSTDSSEVMEHPPLSKIESVKDRDRDHAQSSVNVIGVLKKHKWKGGQRKKKKTLVKMAELLESTEERGQDTKDAGQTKIGQSGTQTQNVQLNYTNKKSHPSFPSPVKEFIYNFSLSPLSDHHTQNPKSHGSTALDILPINTSKSNVKSDLHKKQQDKAFPNVPQVDCLNQPIAIQGSEIASLQKEGNLTDDMTSTKQTSKPTPKKSIHSSKGSKKKNKVKQRKGFGKEADGKVRRQVNAAITQPPLRRKKGKRRKASRREENGLSLNSSSSVEQAPGRSDSTPQELNHSISQGHSTKVQSEVEVTAAVVRHKRTMKEGRKGAKTLKRGRKSPNDYGPSQRALTEDLFVKKDGANLTTSAPASTVPEQRKLQGKEKLPEDSQVTSPQKTLHILKGSGFKKPRLRTARSSAQDIALTVVTAEAAPKTSSPTTSKVRETMASKEDVHLSIANASFEFAEEEFDIPVIKVTTKTDVPFEITRSDEKLSKVETPVSLEGSSNILSKLPGTEAQSTCVHTGAKPVTELSSKQQKQKSTLEQQSTDRCNEVEKQSEIGRKENKDQRHRCTEIKLEQALFALSAIKMGYPTVESSPSTNVSPSPVLKRKVGRPVKKKTLLRMAKTLNIVQEDTSCSTGNSSNNELIQEILPSKNPMQPPRTKKKLAAKPLVTPTRKSNRAVSSIKADVDYSSTSTVSIDTGHKGHADTCSVALHRLSDTMTIGQSFVNKVAQDSEEITGLETDEQDLQESTQVETKTVRAVKSKKKIIGRIKMARRKHVQQLAKVTSLPKDDLLPYNEGGDGKGTAIKPDEAEFALSAVDVGQLADVLPSSSKHTNPSVRLKRKRGRPPSKKTLLREEHQGIQEANSSSTENGGLTVEEIHEEKAQHHAQGQKNGGKNKPSVIPPRRSLRAFGAVREQGDRPSLRATSDHEEDTDMSCTRELSPDSKKTTPNETDEQDVEKVTTVRVMKRKKKALMPKKKKQGWRKLNEKLGRSKSSQENGHSPSHENGADVTEENCKITEIKPEQTESVPVSTGDTEYCEGLQQRSTNQSVLATVKRKVGRPLKKKTLLRMATLVKIVQKEKSRASANMTVDDNLERVLQEKRQQRQSSRIKKEKMTRPAITPERRSLRNTELGKMVKDRSFLDLSEGTDDEENTDTSSRQENTSEQDSEKATVSETDQHDHQQVPEESDTTVVRNLMKKRKRKYFKFSKKKMGKWKKSAQQLDQGISTQEEVDVDGASDGDSAPVTTEDVDALEKVPSVPVSSKEEEEEEEEESYERDSDVKVHCRACCKSSGEEKACGGPLSDIWNGLETDEIPQIPDEPQSPEHMDEECFPQSAYPDLPLASSPARQHLQEHAEKRPYACPLCPETFNNEASVNAHKTESHRLRRALKCDVCGKAFSSLRNWVRHSLLHNGRSSHSCLLCDQSFANNHALQDHLRIHNNDLRFPTAEIPSEPLLFPHQCWWCNVSFSTGELLYAHQICHAVGGKCLPCPPKAPPSAQAPSTITVTSTAPAPSPKQNQLSLAPAQSVSEDAPIPEIDEESLFNYAHPDSLYVVPDPIPPPPIPRHSLSRSKGRSSSQASSLVLSQQTIVLDEEPPPRHSTETSSKAPNASPTVLDASSMQERNLPRTRSQKRMMEAMANLPQLQQTLSSKHKSKEGLKSFSITVTLQDSRGFECADCSLHCF